MKFNSIKINNLYFLFIFPLLISFSYFYFIGRSRYLVTSSYIIRKSGETSLPVFSITSLLSPGNNSSIEDALFLKDYLISPQVFDNVRETINFDLNYNKRGLDFISGINPSDTSDNIYKFYSNIVNINLTEKSGIIHLSTYGFSPQVAYNLNNSLLDISRDFVNKLNQDIYLQQLEFAELQVKEHYSDLNNRKTRLQEFQQKNRILDADLEASYSSQFIVALEKDLIDLKIQLASLRRSFVDPKAPEIENIELQIEELTNQITQERISLVSPKGKNLNKIILQMTEFKSDLDFANSLYLSSLSSLQKIKIDSVQKQRFVANISESRLPQNQYYKWRHRGFFSFITLTAFIFFIIKFIVTMSLNHSQ